MKSIKNSKHKLWLCYAIILSVNVAYTSRVTCQEVEPPNIIWIIAEDLSQDLGCYGAKHIKTPTLDKLASEGIRYTNMFTTAGVCAPSRSAIATGIFQTAIGAMHLRYPEHLKPQLPIGVRTVEEILYDNGYQTVGIGKNDYMFHVNDETFQYHSIDSIENSKPFFAKISTNFTHRKFKKPEQKSINVDSVQLPPYLPDVNVLKKDWALYLENIQMLDDEINRLLLKFENRGLLNNTIIFFFSDHGRPFLRSKYWVYDSGVRIPFIISFPKGMRLQNSAKKGSVDQRLLSSIDISATTLSLAGINIPKNMDGKNFLNEGIAAKREFVFSSIDRIGGSHFKTRSIRSREFKYIRNFNNGISVLELTTEYGKAYLPDYSVVSILDRYNKLTGVQHILVRPLPVEELYDIVSDPYELNNLAYEPEYQDIRNDMEENLMSWIKRIDDQGFRPESRELEEYFINYKDSHKARFREEKLNNIINIKNKLIENGYLENN